MRTIKEHRVPWSYLTWPEGTPFRMYPNGSKNWKRRGKKTWLVSSSVRILGSRQQVWQRVWEGRKTRRSHRAGSPEQALLFINLSIQWQQRRKCLHDCSQRYSNIKIEIYSQVKSKPVVQQSGGKRNSVLIGKKVIQETKENKKKKCCWLCF